MRIYYKGKLEINQSLKTYNEATAIKMAMSLAQETSKEFQRLRKGVLVNDEAERVIRQSGLLPKPISDQKDINDEYNYEDLMREIGESIETIEATTHGFRSSYSIEMHDPVSIRVQQILNGDVPLTLTDAMARRLKVVGEDRVRKQEVERHFNFFIDHLQQETISTIDGEQVESVIDKLEKLGKKSATIKKYVATVSKGVGDLIRFKGSSLLNPFRNVLITGLGKDAVPNHTFTALELAAICKYIRSEPDLVSSHLIGILVNTGCRVGEVAV